jgi:hypothetical protein
MAKKYFAQDINTSSGYTSKIKNIEMMKSAKTSKNPTLNYQLKGKEFIRFWNYDIYLSLVKAFTDMKFVICDDCKCKTQAPSSIIDGITSYQCFEELEEIIKKCQHCKDLTLYPYGKFVQGIQEDECFKFPRKITNDPCERPKPPCPRPCSPKKYCRQNTKGSMRPCRFKQTKPCVPSCRPREPESDSSDSECDIPVTICTNPLLKCYDPCHPCKKYCVKPCKSDCVKPCKSGCKC